MAGMAGLGSGGKDGFSQASVRSYRVFRDQHGRKWGADIEDRTGHPCGQLVPRDGWGTTAPLVPPQKYLVVTDTAAGEITIQYGRWIEDEERALREYNEEAYRVALDKFGDKADEAITEKHPGLLRVVGPPPLPVQRVKAARAGNRWVLGLPNPTTGEPEPKPQWAEEYFPVFVQPAVAEFPNADEEFPDAGADAEDAPTDFPHMYGPGLWYLSDEHRAAVLSKAEKAFRGTGEQAEEAAALRRGEQPVTAGAHESWAD